MTEMVARPQPRPAGVTRSSQERATPVVDLRIETMRWVADDVITVELVSLEAAPLARWAPGAHIEVELSSGSRGRYSLCGDPRDRSRYRIADQREGGGHGTSRELHDAALIGRTVRVRAPRNRFPLEPALSYLFIADGIGVAPILAMATRASEQRAPWRVVYSGRTLSGMAFVDELCRLPGGRVELVPEDESGPLDVTGLLDRLDQATEVYACGPPLLVDALASSSPRLRTGQLHLEVVQNWSQPDQPD
jgi:ferredoxin-NADP reductase